MSWAPEPRTGEKDRVTSRWARRHICSDASLTLFSDWPSLYLYLFSRRIPPHLIYTGPVQHAMVQQSETTFWGLQNEYCFALQNHHEGGPRPTSNSTFYIRNSLFSILNTVGVQLLASCIARNIPKIRLLKSLLFTCSKSLDTTNAVH